MAGGSVGRSGAGPTVLPGGPPRDTPRDSGAARRYPELLALVASGRLRPADLVTRRIPLAEAGADLAAMADRPPAGITVALP